MDPTRDRDPEKATDHGHAGHAELDDFKKVDTTDTTDDLIVDLENRHAVKGDDSDGKVDWTLKQILATIFLSGLYVGRY
jgi:hypothetical protein